MPSSSSSSSSASSSSRNTTDATSVLVDQALLDYYARLYCEPLVLVMNFALCQYLFATYYKRRREVRVQVLLWFGLCGVVSLIPFANPDMRFFGHLNDLSETCSNMTFLVQITILGRDLKPKGHLPSFVWLTRTAELLIFMGFVLAIKSFVELLTAESGLERFDGVDNIFEDVTLGFICVFRFYYQAISKGVAWLVGNRKMELLVYFLFATHEYPFLALNVATGISWESIQALWHRVTMTLCLLQTIKERRSGSSSLTRSKHSQQQTSQYHTQFKARASKSDSVDGGGGAHPNVGVGPNAEDCQGVKTRQKAPRKTYATTTTTTTRGSTLVSSRSFLRHSTVRPVEK